MRGTLGIGCGGTWDVTVSGGIVTVASFLELLVNYRTWCSGFSSPDGVTLGSLGLKKLHGASESKTS